MSENVAQNYAPIRKLSKSSKEFDFHRTLDRTESQQSTEQLDVIRNNGNNGSGSDNLTTTSRPNYLSDDANNDAIRKCWWANASEANQYCTTSGSDCRNLPTTPDRKALNSLPPHPRLCNLYAAYQSADKVRVNSSVFVHLTCAVFFEPFSFCSALEGHAVLGERPLRERHAVGSRDSPRPSVGAGSEALRATSARRRRVHAQAKHGPLRLDDRQRAGRPRRKHAAQRFQLESTNQQQVTSMIS